MRAAYYSEQCRPAMELLIDNGADPNTTARTAAGYAYGVVDYACMLLSAEALQCLLEHGAKPTPQSVGFFGRGQRAQPQS